MLVFSCLSWLLLTFAPGDDLFDACGFLILLVGDAPLEHLLQLVERLLLGVVDSGIAELFEECLAAVGKPVTALTKKDRIKIIALLDQKNAFSYRKSVPFVAKHLQVSRYTIYKYLGELNGQIPETDEE